MRKYLAAIGWFIGYWMLLAISHWLLGSDTFRFLAGLIIFVYAVTWLTMPALSYLKRSMRTKGVDVKAMPKRGWSISDIRGVRKTTRRGEMADYCIPCAIEHHGATEEEARNAISGRCYVGWVTAMLCEGCGKWVWIDPEGTVLEDINEYAGP